MWRRDLVPLMTFAVGVASACETRTSRHQASTTSTAPQVATDSGSSPPRVSGDVSRLNASDLLGLRYGAGIKPPSAVAPLGGWLILPDSTQAWAPEFRITEAYYGSGRVLLLERVYRCAASNSLVWEIVAVQRLPPFPPGYVLARGTCSFGRRADGSIAAIVRAGVERGKPFRVISQAWRADLNRRAFSESPLDGLRCFNKPFNGR